MRACVCVVCVCACVCVVRQWRGRKTAETHHSAPRASPRAAGGRARRAGARRQAAAHSARRSRRRRYVGRGGTDCRRPPRRLCARAPRAVHARHWRRREAPGGQVRAVRQQGQHGRRPSECARNAARRRRTRARARRWRLGSSRCVCDSELRTARRASTARTRPAARRSGVARARVAARTQCGSGGLRTQFQFTHPVQFTRSNSPSFDTSGVKSEVRVKSGTQNALVGP
jgi:hypothetical protein